MKNVTECVMYNARASSRNKKRSFCFLLTYPQCYIRRLLEQCWDNLPRCAGREREDCVVNTHTCQLSSLCFQFFLLVYVPKLWAPANEWSSRAIQVHCQPIENSNSNAKWERWFMAALNQCSIERTGSGFRQPLSFMPVSRCRTQIMCGSEKLV